MLGLIGALIMLGTTVVYTVTTSNLGNLQIKLAKQPFDDVTILDVGVLVTPQSISLSSTTTNASGEISPGVEATSALPLVNTDLVSANFSYKFDVKEENSNSSQ